MIKFNEVTWYLTLSALIFFILILPALTFYIGTKYQEVKIIKKDIQDNINEQNVKKPVATETQTEGCKEIGNERICYLKIFDNEPLYKFKYDGSFTVNVYKNNQLLQTVKLPETKFDIGFIEGFMIALDVNFDGLKDFGMKTCEGATGNVCYDYFLYNSDSGLFEFSEEFTQTNGFPNPLTKEIISHWNNGCAGGCYSDKVYKVENNKPILIKKITQDLDENNKLFIKVIEELKNGVFVTSTTTSTLEY